MNKPSHTPFFFSFVIVVPFVVKTKVLGAWFFVLRSRSRFAPMIISGA